MLEEIKELLDKRYQAYESCMEEYEKVCVEFEQKLMELLPYEGKIIKIEANCTRYIKVKDVFQHGDKIVIRGYGFKSEFTDYFDATFVDWDFMQSYEFSLNIISTVVERIQIITDTEFDKAFNEMINNMRFNHLKEML